MADRLSRRTLLSNAGFLTAVSLAGCLDESGSGDDGTTPTGTPEDSTATDTPTETPEPKSFEEIYEEQTEAEELEDLDLEEVEDLLDSGDSKAEQVQVALTHVGKQVEGQYAPSARHAIEELGMDGVWIDERVWYGGAEVPKVTAYVEEGDGTVKKIISNTVPHNASNPTNYSVRSGQEHSMWNRDQTSQYSVIDFYTVKNRSENWSEQGWEGFDEANNSYLVGITEEANLTYTWDAGNYIAQLEHINNEDHTEAFLNWVVVNEAIHNHSMDYGVAVLREYSEVRDEIRSDLREKIDNLDPGYVIIPEEVDEATYEEVVQSLEYES